MNLPQNQVRIIAGQWRGRKIKFPNVPGLRPSSDRVRETLFNWLQGSLVGSYCLDLFAGSGVLGLEALSRGAASLVAVDASTEAVRALQHNAKLLKATNVECICATVPQVLTQLKARFDLVFIDPPFGQNLVELSCSSLEKHNLLAEKALIYVEMELAGAVIKFPGNWQLLREMKTQQVRALLFKKCD